MGWLAAQTAGQCGPCVHGLAAIAGELAGLHGRARRRPATAWTGCGAGAARSRGRGACHHPDGAARFLLSALEVFEPEFELHRRFGAVRGLRRAGRSCASPSRRCWPHEPAPARATRSRAPATARAPSCCPR